MRLSALVFLALGVFTSSCGCFLIFQQKPAPLSSSINQQRHSQLKVYKRVIFHHILLDCLSHVRRVSSAVLFLVSRSNSSLGATDPRQRKQGRITSQRRLNPDHDRVSANPAPSLRPSLPPSLSDFSPWS